MGSAFSPAAAPHSAGGFYYQLPYATLAALNLDIGETLGVEILDDVHRSGADGTKLIQLKKSTTPVTDMNEGLWKALANWSKFISSGSRYDLSMLFVTTAPIHGGFPDLLTRKTSGEERRKYVLESINPSKNEDLTLVKSLPAGILASLLGRVSLVREGSAAELFHKIRNKLRLCFHDEYLEPAAREFEGWILKIVTVETTNGRGAVISESEVRDVLLNIQSRCRPPTQRYHHGDTAVDAGERADHRNSTFLRQLEAINATGALCNMALEDYLRQTKEEVEWAKNLEVGKQDLVNYRKQIYEIWRLLSIDIPGRLRHLDDDSHGLTLCDEMLKSRSPRLLSDDVPPAHVFRGSCHKLANMPSIGWHRKWRELFCDNDLEDKA